MKSGKVTVINPQGFHLKPSGRLCELALTFQSKITYRYDNVTANAKSVLSVLASKVRCGQELEFFVSGVDEEEAIAAILEAVRTGLGEEII